jgi:hypothetical protein
MQVDFAEKVEAEFGKMVDLAITQNKQTQTAQGECP